MEKRGVNSSTKEKNLYLPILNAFKETTNLTIIRKKFGLSRQNLNNYIRELVKNGYLVKQQTRGHYEVNRSKDMTKYDRLLGKDFTRGHAYVWEIEFSQEIKDWSKRIKILQDKGIHFNLVGALKTTPRIMILGRKVWLCNDKIRIYDKPNSSYYGRDAIESKYSSFHEVKAIVGALNHKLGLFLHPSSIKYQKQHYALINNDLAIEENRKGNIVRVKDEEGEWLLIDDSLGEGGELETVGKKSFETNIPLQKWWNDQKATNFQVTPTFLMESINKVTENQQMFARNIEKHMAVLESMDKTLKLMQKRLSQTKLTEFL